MSGGVDQGLPGDKPFVGRDVLYLAGGKAHAAKVTWVHDDGWRCNLVYYTPDGEQFTALMVPYTELEFDQELPDEKWALNEQLEGWKIWDQERRARGE